VLLVYCRRRRNLPKATFHECTTIGSHCFTALLLLLLAAGALSELGRFYQAAALTSLPSAEFIVLSRCCWPHVRCLSWAASTRRLALTLIAKVSNPLFPPTAAAVRCAV
jgi:hypothetical protein